MYFVVISLLYSVGFFFFSFFLIETCLWVPIRSLPFIHVQLCYVFFLGGRQACNSFAKIALNVYKLVSFCMCVQVCVFVPTMNAWICACG